MCKIKGLLSSLFFFCCIGFLNAQITIAAIEIEGNKKTRDYIIKRELPYKVGDFVTQDSLLVLNTIAQQQLFNTALFLEAIVIASPIDASNVKIKIRVKERWYFFPLPYFKWVDRNFSQWWNEQGRSLDRVNYGINLRQGNATGNNDKLIVSFITGYTDQLLLRYQIPFIDKKLRFGLGVGFASYTQKEINYNTLQDKQIFYKTEDINRKGYRANVNLSYRPNLYERHNVQIGFGKDEISDSAFKMQPRFLPSLQKELTYFDITASYSKLRFNYNAYPSEGQSTELVFFQRLSRSSNLSSLQFRKVIAYPFSKKHFVFFESNTALRLLPNNNYLDKRLFGYGNLQLNGLEYYVVDGNAGSLLRSEYHHLLGAFTLKNPITQQFLPEVKYTFWLKLFSNLGYVYNEQKNANNRLANTLLRTAGIGLDIISIYDFVLNIEYSINQLGDKGVYLHGGINF